MQAIAAMSENRVIGINGKIPWHIKEDFQWFKEFTMGKAPVMGKKTYDSLPPKKLPGRFIGVLSKNWEVTGALVGEDFSALGFTLHCVEQVRKFGGSKEVVVCGGAQVYKQLLPECDELYLTVVKGEYNGDTFMPPFEHIFKGYEIIRAHEKFTVRRYFKLLDTFPQANC